MIGRSGLAMLLAGVSMPVQVQGEPAANAQICRATSSWTPYMPPPVRIRPKAT